MLLRHNILGFLWAIVILLLSISSSSQFPSSAINGIDKIVHLFFYLFLSLLLTIGFKKQTRLFNLKKFACSYALYIAIIYGVIIEIFQGFFFISRSMEIADVLTNSLGSLLGVTIFKLIYGSLKNT